MTSLSVLVASFYRYLTVRVLFGDNITGQGLESLARENLLSEKIAFLRSPEPK